MKRYLLILTALFALLAGQAHAQRCLPRMKGIELRGGMVDGFYGGTDRSKTGYYFSGALSTYTKRGNKWVFGGEYLLRNNPYKGIRIPTAQFTLEGGYHYNFLSDARKIFFLYIGGSALAGYETVNWGEKTLYDGARLTGKDSFVYGGALTLDMEVYIADRVALLATLRERCLWGGDTGKFHTQFAAGIKFIIN
ncbi:conjugative transposon TraO family protein [Bacteroides fragilis str. S24L15]|uniref:conjugal transfer protein TraO n=1 Tax=Bacteroides fragilis TaxID=817 RepID=UPI000450E4EB|nr:conjugal transfer protein TraO [Bacteroides fragilis]EYA71772.1 conjugative transposon TraO family protein [Bacteroides fragilis str. S24L15]